MDSVQKWRPGDVAEVTMRHKSGTEQTWSLCMYTDDGSWVSSDSGRLYSDTGVWKIVRTRPLVVIDPEDRKQVERLVNLVDDCFNDVRVDGTGPTAVDLAQTRLREFASPTPPKPDEPKSYLAVVQVADGRRYWRWSAGDAHTGWPWRLLGAVHADTEDDGNFRWDDLAVVEVVSAGVEVPSC